MERLGQLSHDVKAQRLPQMDSGLIGRDHEIKLDSPEADAAAVVDGVAAQGSRNAAPAGGRGCHVAAIGDVVAATLLIGTHIAGAQDDAILLGNEIDLFWRCKIGTRDIAAYREVLGEKISALPYVAHTSTHVSMEAVKDDAAERA